MQQHSVVLKDAGAGVGTQRVTVEISELGISINPKGYGDHNTQDGYGSPMYLELHDGKLTLYVWADINQEDPTHKIDLSGALESRREGR